MPVVLLLPVVVIVELSALPEVVGPPVVSAPEPPRIVDGAEVVLRVDVRHKAHQDRENQQPARLQQYNLHLSGALLEFND